MMETLLNEKLLSIWSSASEQETRSRLPLFFKKPQPERLLFIGLNPSFSPKGFKKVLTGKHQGTDTEGFYKFLPTVSIDYSKHEEIEEQSFKQHPYFAKFREISADLEIPWEHIDLFAVRETNQAALKDYLIDRNGNLTVFGSQQIELSKQAIRWANPKVIVVANALASRIFEKEFSAKFDETTGYHTVLISEREVPVFLTSMLTGQRALDNFSRLRLRWHIVQAIRNSESSKKVD